MRNKVVLIKGWLNIAREITLAEFERIYADNIVLIAALRRPQFLPPEMGLDPTSLVINCKKIMEHWRIIDQDHFLMSEYASVALDHGSADIKAVEGDSLRVLWFYETVKAIHRHFGQTIIEAEVLFKNEGQFVRIDQEEYPLEEAVKRLKPHPILG